MRKLIFIWLACIVVITACTILSHTSMKQSLSYHTYDEQYEVLEQAKELLNQTDCFKKLVSYTTDKAVARNSNDRYKYVSEEEFRYDS